MKSKEITQPSARTLTESFSKNNNTGFLVEDLVKMYRTHNGESWVECSYEDMIDEMDRLEAEYDFRHNKK